MKHKPCILLVIVCMLSIVLLATGCSTPLACRTNSLQNAVTQRTSSPPIDATDRMLVRIGSVTLKVNDVSEAVSAATETVKHLRGRVEYANVNGRDYGTLTARVPTATLDVLIEDVVALGHEIRRSISSTDVTHLATDLDAVMNSKIALRDRLRKLLDRINNMDDLLTLEAQLARVQAEIDSLAARLKTLRNQAAMATLTINFNRDFTPGPVTYIGRSTLRLIRKLFILD